MNTQAGRKEKLNHDSYLLILRMKSTFKRIAAALTALATVGSTFLTFAPARAASYSNASDTMSRLKISTQADHVIRLTLPSGVTFDGSSTTSDALVINFPDTFTSSASGTWTTADFTFNDGTARTVTTVATPGTNGFDVSCATGANNVGVVVDTTSNAFKVKPCGATYVSSTSTSTITFTISGTTGAGGGTLANPSSAGSYTVSASGTDLGAANAHSSQLAVSIMDDDQVTVTATVDPSITFDIDIQTSCGSESAAPYSVSLGTLTSTAVTTASSRICLGLDTNAAGGAIVTVQGSGSADALESAASGDSIGTTYVAGNGGVTLLAAGTEGYGLCVAATSTVTGSATGVAPYNASCVDDNVGGVDSAAPQQIVTTNGAAVDGTANNTAEIRVRASISGTTAAATDYTDILTFIATGTF